MRVILTSHGSTGDIFPMIAFGVRLQQSGHSVRFATSRPFQEEIEAAGLEFLDIPPPWTREDLAWWMGRLQRHATPLMQLRALYLAAKPHIPALIDEMDRHLPTADVLVSSYLFPMNRALAERHAIAFATFAFAHNTVPSRFHPPEGLPRLRFAPESFQHRWNRNCWRIGNLLVDTVINRMIAPELRSRDLPRVKDFFSKPADLVLVAVSKALMHPPFELNPRFRFVGYNRWQSPRDEAMENRILEFTGGRRIPVLTFGSMVCDEPAGWMQRLIQHWPRERKMIVQEGWGGFRIPAGQPQFLGVGPCSHDQLFHHASVVIHHGGAGTTASVLHAGRPHIVVPHIGDQSFFSGEVKRLGVGRRIRKKTWPENLWKAVLRVEADSRIGENAAAARLALSREDGPGEAVRQLEAFVAGRPPASVGPSGSEEF